MAALLMLALSGWAQAAERPTDLELYAASSLAGLHSHPIGGAGVRLDRAERAIGKRRGRIRDWLVAREGEAAVDRIDDEIADEVHSVFWTRGPTEAEEWATIAAARRALDQLERRRHRSKGRR